MKQYELQTTSERPVPMSSKPTPPPASLGIPYDEAVSRGICGARRKNEAEPCEGPRDSEGRSVCGRHCGAKNSRGYPCSKHGLENLRCRNHGGRSLVGPDSPRWEHGRDSKMAPIFTGPAMEHYEAARRDPRYLELRENIAILETLKVEELAAAAVGRGGEFLRELGEAWKRARSADAKKDPRGAGEALREVGRLITEGVGRDKAYGRALDVIERHRKTTETERRRVVDQERTITQAQAMSYAAAYNALLRESLAGEPNEREVLARFNAGAARLVSEYVGGGTPG